MLFVCVGWRVEADDLAEVLSGFFSGHRQEMHLAVAVFLFWGRTRALVPSTSICKKDGIPGVGLHIRVGTARHSAGRSTNSRANLPGFGELFGSPGQRGTARFHEGTGKEKAEPAREMASAR